MQAFKKISTSIRSNGNDWLLPTRTSVAKISRIKLLIWSRLMVISDQSIFHKNVAIDYA